MTQRTKAAAELAAYFETKGRILTSHEYAREQDTPIRLARVKQIFGGWNRMENIVRTFNGRNAARDEEAPTTDVNEVLRRAAEAAAEYEAKMRAASENVEAKTAREAAAQSYIEADKLRAATPEGAYENKMRKGGVTTQDAKAKKEAVEQAPAEEHAMLAKSGAGSALGKQLLGGVEDNDEKTRVIAEQNAFREAKALKAATPLGSAEAKLMEDDTDGQLSREAQARVRAELRTYVPPEVDGNVEKAVENATKKVRDEVREVVMAAASDENVMTDSVMKASLARVRARRVTDEPVSATDLDEDVQRTMTPADQLPDEEFVLNSEIKDAKGEKTLATIDKPGEAEQDATKEMTSEADENKENPEAPPADRNPDPALTSAPATDKTRGENKETPEIVFPDSQKK